ncbi:glycosyltransferase family 9 protein [Marinicella rhabdoformis]|uniref:glycosyltransferase family 9 protein n=1 Tax=Marinicella rhabdoformis TaxID=2580566 RepID=UPI0012AEC906|nr:glycosyltransferase family 9 protein [Marinicella rhabdoformis]
MTTNHLSKHLSDPQNICIFRLSAIGDVTHMVPVIKTLQHRFPSCKITWIVGTLEHKLLAGLKGVEFIVFNKSSGWKGINGLRKALSGRRFDVLLQMQLSMRANLLSLLISAKRRIGYDNHRSKELHSWVINESIPYLKDIHVLDGFMQFATYLGCQQKVLDWHIPVDETDVLLAKRIMNPENMSHLEPSHKNVSVDDVLQGKRNFESIHQINTADAPHKTKVIISPCSSHKLRNWSVKNYAALCDHLVQKHDAQVLLCGSPAASEKAFISEIEQACHVPVLNIAGQDTLKQLLCLMQMVNLVVSPDSGPLHMAGSVGTPVIGLLAASNYKRSGSYQFPEFTVDAYPEACKKFLNKDVDDVKWGTKTEFEGAMDLIKISDVTDKVDQLLSK